MLFTSLLAPLRHAFNRWQADRLERAVFRELLRLGPRLLDDIGLSIGDVAASLEDGRKTLRHADRLAALEALRRAEEPPEPLLPARGLFALPRPLDAAGCADGS